MNKHREQELLDRLDAIGRAVSASGHGLALLGLGSVGQEQERLDAFSDLDFFVIARLGRKAFFLQSLNWLEQVQPVVFSFQNTADGHKLLFADGIFCETAVFTPEELPNIPYSGARVIWQDENSRLSFPENNNLPQSEPADHDAAWLIGEILTNLYVGLGRFQRGEKLTAARFIQGHAVDRILELAAKLEEPGPAQPDPFDRGRRFEQRFPQTAVWLPEFLPGYDLSPQAALAILHFLETNCEVNQQMKEAILQLI